MSIEYPGYDEVGRDEKGVRLRRRGFLVAEETAALEVEDFRDPYTHHLKPGTVRLVRFAYEGEEDHDWLQDHRPMR